MQLMSQIMQNGDILLGELIQKINLSGKVVELYKCQDKNSAKIIFDPVFLKLPAENLQYIHLEDQISLQCEIKIININPMIDTER